MRESLIISKSLKLYFWIVESSHLIVGREWKPLPNHFHIVTESEAKFYWSEKVRYSKHRLSPNKAGEQQHKIRRLHSLSSDFHWFLLDVWFAIKTCFKVRSFIHKVAITLADKKVVGSTIMTIKNHFKTTCV